MSLTLVKAWKSSRERLEAMGVPGPVIDARLLVEAAADATRADIITDPLPYGDINNGRVTAQSPSETQTAMPGDTVRIKVGKAGPAPTTTSSTTTTTVPPGTTGL